MPFDVASSLVSSGLLSFAYDEDVSVYSVPGQSTGSLDWLADTDEGSADAVPRRHIASVGIGALELFWQFRQCCAISTVTEAYRRSAEKGYSHRNPQNRSTSLQGFWLLRWSLA
jgi:hypothetical protein